jgi:DNA-directed RNA polymerase I, II, and III subunit RPABC3
MASSKQDEGMDIGDTYEILEVDPDGKKFDKVSRIMAHSELYDLDLVLDVRALFF